MQRPSRTVPEAPVGKAAAASGGGRRTLLPLVLVLTLVWGTAWSLFPLAVREVSVWTFRAVSVTGAGAALLLFAHLRGEALRIPRSSWGTLVAASLVYLGVWNVASTYAAVLIPSGQAAVLGFTMPLWATLIAWAWQGRRPVPRVLLALVIGSAGVLLLVSDGIEAYARAPLGFALGLLAAIGWACGTILLKRRPLPVSAVVAAGWQMLVAAVPITAGAWWWGDGRWFIPSPASMLVMAYVTLVPMALGNVVWFAIVRLLPAATAGLTSVMVPVVALLSGAWVHGEPLGITQWLAVLCCSCGLLLTLVASARGAPGQAPQQRVVSRNGDRQTDRP